MLQAAFWSEQAKRELHEAVCRLQQPLILCCMERERQKGRQEKCGSELLIKGGTEGGGREIRVDEKRLSFNRGKR